MKELKQTKIQTAVVCDLVHQNMDMIAPAWWKDWRNEVRLPTISRDYCEYLRVGTVCRKREPTMYDEPWSKMITVSRIS